jgi:hypothetical protein
MTKEEVRGELGYPESVDNYPSVNPLPAVFYHYGNCIISFREGFVDTVIISKKGY